MNEVTTYSWSYENQLVGAELPDESEVVYRYAPVNKNSDELRISKETDAGLIQYIWDAQNIIRELDDTGLVEAEYTLNPQPYGDLVSQSRDDESSFYLFDALGSTESLTDETGAQTDAYLYKAFGEILSQSGTTDNPFTWVGELGYYRDPETGLYQLRRRPIDSDLGRFISEDPTGFAAGDENLYRYVRNSPVDRTDPSGLGKTFVELDGEGNVRFCWDRYNLWIKHKECVFVGTYDNATNCITRHAHVAKQRGHAEGRTASGKGWLS